MVGSVIAEFTAFAPQGEAVEPAGAGAGGPGQGPLRRGGRPEGAGGLPQGLPPDTNEAFAPDYDLFFLPATLEYTAKKAKEASAPVYNYLFAKVFDFDGGRPAWHCSDIPYFFHNGALVPICQQENGDMLDAVMSGAFVNFARTGDPNCDGLPQWDKCEEGKLVTMVFDDTCEAKVNLHDELLPLAQAYKPATLDRVLNPRRTRTKRAAAPGSFKRNSRDHRFGSGERPGHGPGLSRASGGRRKIPPTPLRRRPGPV